MIRPNVATNSLKYIFNPLLEFSEICTGSMPNIILLIITPKNPPTNWAQLKQENSFNVNSFFKNIIKLTAGLKFAPEIEMNIQINAVSPAPVAMVFARRILN